MHGEAARDLMNVHDIAEPEVNHGRAKGGPLPDTVLHDLVEALRHGVKPVVHLHRVAAQPPPPLGKMVRQAPRATTQSSYDSTPWVSRRARSLPASYQ
jgi:hypothetical protein